MKLVPFAVCLALLGAPALADPGHEEAERRCLMGEHPRGQVEVGMFEVCVDLAGKAHPRRPYLTFDRAPASPVLLERVGFSCRQEWRPTPSCVAAWTAQGAGPARASSK
jgi:hypothetical protein